MLSSTVSFEPSQPSTSQTVVGGRYRIVSLLGVGGMGSVYRAFDLELEEPVALKVLRRDLVGAPGILERFRREVKLARKVTHPNVARTFDIGEHETHRTIDRDRRRRLMPRPDESLLETHALEGRTSLLGLDDTERHSAAADFFAKLPWEPLELDPGNMTAEQFLTAL